MEELNLRPLCCELNVLTNSDGSAMLCEGMTSIIVSVYGPVEVKMQKILIDRAFVETYYRPRSGQTCVDDRFIELFLKNICESSLHINMYPRTAITINVQEMHDNGGKLACSVNACCLALINSGLSMKYLTAGVTCLLNKDNEFVMDPSQEDETTVASFTFVFENVNYFIVASHTTGAFSDEQYAEAVEKCKAASIKIFEFYRNIVTTYAKKLNSTMK